jgi:hypothetical protein
VFDEADEKEKVKNIQFFSYNVFPIGFKKGIIKVVSGITLKKVLDDYKSLKDYFKSLSKNDENRFKILTDNYFKSCGQFYSIMTLVFLYFSFILKRVICLLVTYLDSEIGILII